MASTFESGMPTAPPTFEPGHGLASVTAIGANNEGHMATAANGTAQNAGFFKRNAKRIGAVAGAAVLVGGTYFITEKTSDNGGGNNGEPAAAVGETNQDFAEACPEGMFSEGLYEASLDVSTPGNLHRQPTTPLKNSNELTGYVFGENGVACDSVLTLAVTKAAMNSVTGEGAAQARGFDVFGSVDEQVAIYTEDTEIALNDAEKLAELMESYSMLNPEEIVGAYQKVVGVVNGEIVTAAVEPIDAKFAPETVFVVAPQGDVAKSNNTFLIDSETGDYYLLNNIGLAEAPKDQDEAEGQENLESQEGQADQDDAEGQSDQGVKGGGGSGSKEGKGGGKGGSEKGCGGDCGDGGQETGNGGGAGNGGGEECADGCGSGGGGSKPTGPTGPKPTNPPATQPPTTKPPVTQPPTTKPPVTTPPTTKPPVTPPTTRPKGPEPTTTLPPGWN